MTSNRSQGAIALITVDCPWCDGPAQIGDADLHCPACAITVVVADDVQEPALTTAA